MSAVVRGRCTYEEVRALLDAQEDRAVRFEYADGELIVTPAPGGYHQRLVLELYERIAPYVRSQGLGEARLGPSPLALVPGTVFQPDLYVVPAVSGRRPRADVQVIRALLVIEVLSPGSLHHDRVTKRRHYQQAGVGQYWIVDLESAVIERWQPGYARPEILDGHLSWSPAGARQSLEIDVAALFSAVSDDDDPA